MKINLIWIAGKYFSMPRVLSALLINIQKTVYIELKNN